VSVSLQLAYAGTPEFAVPPLDALIKAGHRIAAVLTQPDRPKGRGRALQASPVKERALELGLPVCQPATLRDEPAEVAGRLAGIDALIVAAYGLMLPPAVLAIPRLGCFNIHASLLPRWRGAAPIQRALLAGDAETGISIMRMEAGLDTGPVLLAERVAIFAFDNSASLQKRLAELGAALMLCALEQLAIGRVPETAQDSARATYAAKISKTEAVIDWRCDAQRIARQVRAFNPWPVAETRWQGQTLRIWQAQPSEQSTAAAPGRVTAIDAGLIHVACGRGALAIAELQLPGRKPLPAQEFCHGHDLANAHFGAA
jgi:methionyl-tRNA formyltransferase